MDYAAPCSLGLDSILELTCAVYTARLDFLAQKTQSYTRFFSFSLSLSICLSLSLSLSCALALALFLSVEQRNTGRTKLRG